MLKAILFDLHGILISKFPLEPYLKGASELFISKGYDFDIEDLKIKYGTLSFATYKLGFHKDYLSMLDNLPILEDKDEELIELLGNIKQKMYIVTDTSTKNCIRTLNLANIDTGLFNAIFTGNDVTEPKPSTELYKLVLNEGFKPEECLIIGDRLTDIMPAYELGIGGLLCNYDTFKNILRLIGDKE